MTHYHVIYTLVRICAFRLTLVRYREFQAHTLVVRLNSVPRDIAHACGQRMWNWTMIALRSSPDRL